jgi:hypothetical protein
MKAKALSLPAFSDTTLTLCGQRPNLKGDDKLILGALR